MSLGPRSKCQLLAAQNEARNVVKLTRGADERIHLLQQILHGLLRALPLQGKHARHKPRVTEFFAFLVECIHHSIGEEKQRIVRREFTMAVAINRVIEKPERRPMLAAVQRLRVSAIFRAMNAQRTGMSRIRVAQFAFLQIREQVKGRSKERDLTIF